MSQIRITPEELEDGAKFIEDQREEIVGRIKDLKSKIDTVAGNWEGAAQSSFLASFNDMYSPTLIQTFPEILTGISTQLKGAAKTLRDADNEIAKAMKG